MNFKYLLPLLFICFFFAACFEKLEQVPPTEFDGSAFVLEESFYETQFYYSLGSNKILRQNNNNKWDLAFENGKNNKVVRINNAKLLEVWPTGISNFSTTDFSGLTRKWIFDKSDGDEDSLAIKDWFSGSNAPYNYSNEVFIIGVYNGTHNNPLKKVSISLVTDSSYQFKYANLDGTDFHEVIVRKDTVYNRVFYSFANNDTVFIEPPKKDWDLLFTNYSTTLYTDDGIPVYYPVRGTLINSYKVSAVLDTVNNFFSISRETIQTLNYSTKWDAIGYDWKSVVIDEQSNTAVYKVRPNNFYIIKATDDNIYKLKFLSFYKIIDNKSYPGYPSFLFKKL